MKMGLPTGPRGIRTWKVESGCYETLDGRWRVFRVDDGPRGQGCKGLWSFTDFGGNAEPLRTWPTKREVLEYIENLLKLGW